MFLVPQESILNSNMTLEPSVCLGPQEGSKRVVLSGWTEGQVEERVVTTVMVPSVEQTETRGSTPAGPDLRKLQRWTELPIMSWVLKRQRLDMDVWTSRLLKSLRKSWNVPKKFERLMSWKTWLTVERFMKLKTFALLSHTEGIYKHLVPEPRMLSLEGSFLHKEQPWLTKVSYFICVSNGEEGDLQNSLLGLDREKVPSLESQLTGEGLLVDTHFPQTVSLRRSHHAEDNSSVQTLSCDLWRDFKELCIWNQHHLTGLKQHLPAKHILTGVEDSCCDGGFVVVGLSQRHDG